MIHIREYDGDPLRNAKQQQQRQHHPEGDGDAAAASGLSAFAPDATQPQCIAHYVVQPPTTANAANDLHQQPPSRSSTACGALSRLSSSPSIPARTWQQSLHHGFVVRPQRIFADLFLPLGYPESVGEGYLVYQAYDSLQGICSYLRGVVATSAVLMAAGVGDADATAMSAAVNWALRDGTGMVGGLLFSYVASAQFDSYVKEFRLFADVINDVGLTLDMLAPHAGRGRVLYVTSLATMCKTMCGMAAGATKGSITHHFAIHGNMADLNSKESTQETLVSLLGMIFGIGLARYLHRLEKQGCGDGNTAGGVEEECIADGTAKFISWTIFIFLTIVHVWANYLGVKILRLRTLNRERAEVALGNVINECTSQCEGNLLDHKKIELSNAETLLESILSPHDVSESLLSSVSKLVFPGKIRLDAHVHDAFRGVGEEGNSDSISDTLDEFDGERYFLTVNNRDVVSVVLCAGSTEEDELKAFVHAMVLSALCKRERMKDREETMKKSGNFCKGRQRYLLTVISHMCICQLFTQQGPGVVNSKKPKLTLDWLKERGWETNRLYLGVGQYRAQISDERKKEE